MISFFVSTCSVLKFSNTIILTLPKYFCCNFLIFQPSGANLSLFINLKSSLQVQNKSVELITYGRQAGA